MTMLEKVICCTILMVFATTATLFAGVVAALNDKTAPVVKERPRMVSKVAPVVPTIVQQVGKDNVTREELLELYMQCYQNVENMHAPKMERRRQKLKRLMHNEQIMTEYFVTMSNDLDRDKSTCFKKYFGSHEYMESLK